MRTSRGAFFLLSTGCLGCTLNGATRSDAGLTPELGAVDLPTSSVTDLAELDGPQGSDARTVTDQGTDADTRCRVFSPAVHWPAFGGGPQRTGWNPHESALDPAALRAGRLGLAWSTGPLDEAVIGGRRYAPHLYASPLYIDDLSLEAGPYAGRRVGAVIAATSNGWVYALHAEARDCGDALDPGTVLWRTQVARPGLSNNDGGVPLGVLSTPVIDQATGRIYVSAMDATLGWTVSALDLARGTVLSGWPVRIVPETLAGVTRNGPALFNSPNQMSQRGALNLSPDGSAVYVSFGTYGWAAPGWMVAIDTRRPSLRRAFAASPSLVATSSGGMWGSGGPAVSADGTVYMTTGNSPRESEGRMGVWGNSLLAWDPELNLRGTYTPFNYCVLDQGNMDLGGCGPLLLPALTDGQGRRRELLVVTSKQSMAYLLDRAQLPGRTDRRELCRSDASTDPSLLGPSVQAMFGTRGPLHVFPVYSDRFGQFDHARMRSTPAYFRDTAGAHWLFISGSSRAREEDTTSVPPGIARLRLNLPADGAPHLTLERHERVTTLVNPGSPVVSSDGGDHPLVWVMDSGLPRSAPLVRADSGEVPGPALHAFDGTTLEHLWRSSHSMFRVGGKYSSPTVAHGQVFAGTDRLFAFGLRPSATSPEPRCQTTSWREDFEAYQPGENIGGMWLLGAMAPRAFVRASNALEGQGASGSPRYALLYNLAVPGRAVLSMTTPAFDLRGCTSAMVTFNLAAFSMEEAERDRAWIEIAGPDERWRTVEAVYPSWAYHDDLTCRPGRQSTGCTRWTRFTVPIPGALLSQGTRLRVVMDSSTDVSDALGVDDVVLTAE